MGTLTSYLEVARPFCQTSQIQLTGRSDNVNVGNNYFYYLKRNLFIPDAAEVSEAAGNTEDSEVNEEDKEASGGGRVRKKNLALKVTEMMSLFYLCVLF